MSAERAADLARLIDLIEQFPRQTILVVADFVADEFVFGEISRVSREAPVLILRHREMHTLPGGGANAANNLADLGARVRPVAALGDDAAGDALAEYFRQKKIDTSGLVRKQRLDDSREDTLSWRAGRIRFNSRYCAWIASRRDCPRARAMRWCARREKGLPTRRRCSFRIMVMVRRHRRSSRAFAAGGDGRNR